MNNTPWNKLITDDMLEREGPYADFAAFKIWVGESLDVLELETCDLVYVYDLVCRVIHENSK